jgi:hypothetical protein
MVDAGKTIIDTHSLEGSWRLQFWFIPYGPWSKADASLFSFTFL